ncbi:MAG: hypothetical protein LBB48_01425 [Treponema sp.]|jgi:hypothetical protein|nr:hypothetical protein [Treponema sp.]
MIHGYSERGIVNSIAYFLDANSLYVYDFVTTLGISLPKFEYNYTFIIEQSFSDFGDSDLIIIIKNNTNDEKIVLFIECKIKTYQGSFKILSEFNKISNALTTSKKIKGISSNLFVQLYYKYLLIKTSDNSDKDMSVNSIFKKNNGNSRVLGNNKIVTDAFNKIKDANDYYYVAITPTAPDEMDTNGFRCKIKELNLMPWENTYLCYWGKVKEFFDTIGANKVKEVFDYNYRQIY